MAGYHQMVEVRNRSCPNLSGNAVNSNTNVKDALSVFFHSIELNNKRGVRTMWRNMETKGETEGEALCFTASVKVGHGF